eukprot:GHVN01069300.1.p1 GENE.GHVN01069300.1~~GHVN01069300.1.p1  ORF type:complete len:167 (+),score=11.25 GHVN01069300.1:739-1239(+)
MLGIVSVLCRVFREDRDVRMLGQGRPFLVEVMEPDLSVCTEADTCRGLLRYANMDPHMFEVTRLIREVSGGRVEVEQLAASVEDSQQVNHNFRTLQQLCEEKTKVYGCVVWLADHMSKDGLEETFKFIKLPIVLQQQTPIRVLHRRKNDTRFVMFSSGEASRCVFV